MKEKNIKNKKAALKKTLKRAPVKKAAAREVAPKAAGSQPAAARLINLHDIRVPYGAHKKRKLLGRGPGSGHGKTSTRGSKGQTSRAGRHFYLGFEGGQSPLIRKMPKRGFASNFRKVFQVVNLEALNKIKDSLITPDVLKQNGLIRDQAKLIKILGEGILKHPVHVQAHAFSKRAAVEIAKIGGKAEIIIPALT